MYQDGADVVYHAAGGSGGGVFTAAKAAGKLAIGVDSDQAKTAPADVRDVIMTSMIKKVDVAVYDFIKSVGDGKAFKAGNKVYDLKADGVDYSTTGGQIDDIKTKLDELQAEDHLGRDHGPDPDHPLIAGRERPCGVHRRPGRRGSVDPGRVLPDVPHPAPRPVRSRCRSNARPTPATRRARTRSVCHRSNSPVTADGRRSRPRRSPAVELEGITKRFPGVVANKDITLTVRHGHGPRDRRRERRRQVDADEDPLRRAAARRGHDQGRRRGTSTCTRRPTPSPPASAWSSSTSCSPTTSPSSRTSSSAPRSCTASATRPARRSARSPTPTGSTSTPTRSSPTSASATASASRSSRSSTAARRILILDEPTAVLVPQEVDELFDNLRELKSEGLTVMFISHKLDEVLTVADAITVIRRGTTVDTVDPSRSTPRQLAELMVGSELPSPDDRGVDGHRPGRCCTVEDTSSPARRRRPRRSSTTSP